MLSSNGKIKNSLLPNADQTLADITDVAFSPISSSDILMYNGSKWVNHPGIKLAVVVII